MSWHKQSNDKSPCVECRKRRIRCERPFPCQHCVKQGLAEACIQGSIVKGTRSLKASSIILHEDLAKMSVREQKLEEALAEAQSSISTETHPLLVRDSQIRMASPVPGLQRTAKVGTTDAPNQAPDTGADELVASLGMMSLSEKQQYHGDTATSEYLIQGNDEDDGQGLVADIPAKRRPPPPVHLPAELFFLTLQFPFPPPNQRIPMDAFLQFLPPYERAFQLIHMYHSYYAWCTMLAPSTEVIEKLFYPFYPNGVVVASVHPSDAHRLALLFMIFLLGTLYDLELDMECVSADAELFHNLARAAMASYPVVDFPTVEGIQALVLMIWYFRLFPGRRPHSYQWLLTGILTKLVQAIGLHRDGSATILDPMKRATLEQTFWEYNSVDIWQSFMFGRPTSMVSGAIDCKRPSKVDVTSSQNPDFFPWKYSFTQLVSDVLLQMTHSASYEDVLRHEKRLRSHPKPSSLAWPPRGIPFPEEPVGKTFQRYLAAVWENVSIMYLHRRLLVDMLRKCRDNDPTTSPYWQSAVVAYESARAVVHDMRRLWLTYPRFIERMAPFWSHTTTAGLLLGTLIAYIPGCEFAEDALQHLDETCEMFAEARDSLQPPNCLPALRKSQRQARYAFSKLHDPLATSGMKMDDADISPSESQFPFTFGESPPRVGDQLPYVSGPTGGSIQPSIGFLDNQLVYRPVNGGVGQAPALLSPISQSGNGYTGVYDVEPHPRNSWNQLLSQVKMQC